jgi:hypothetical protein
LLLLRVTRQHHWLHSRRTIRNVDAAFAAQTYVYPHVGELAQYNTVELYASASAEGFIGPTVTVSYDVARIRGAYVETGVSRAITGERHGSVTVGFLAGLSAGQAADPRGRDLAYFDHDGITHIEASPSASFNVSHIVVEPEAHLIFAHDALATVIAPDATRRTKLWLGTTLRWTNERATR